MELKITAARQLSENPIQENYKLHTHENYEIFCFLSGNADYSVEGNRYKLLPGDIVIMRKNEFHHLILKSNAPYERIIVNFSSSDGIPDASLLAPFEQRKAGQKNLYRPSNIQDNNLVFYLKKMIEVKEEHRKICWLLPFLDELNDAFQKENSYEKPIKDKATDVINYINKHLTEDLSLLWLSEHFFISQNHLNRIFKESTGTTLWDYVTVKRLILAKDKIELGAKPTEAYLAAGFKDYATFFRAYKKHFGTSPKKTVSN